MKRTVFLWRVLWEPRDLWVGVFWKRGPHPIRLIVYVCIVPCFPLVLQWATTEPAS